MSGSSATWSAELGRFLRAQLSSGTATMLDWALMAGLILAKVHYLVAIVCGCAIGAVTDFSLKRLWAFRAKATAVPAQAARYTAVSAASAGLNCAIAYGLATGLSMPKLWAAVLASVLAGVAFGYPMHRLVVFRTPSREGGL